MFEQLEKFSQPLMIIGGDFNLTMSPGKDRLVLFPTTTDAKVSRLSTSFRRLVRAHNNLDIWRIKHPIHRQYTFYSPPPKLYSRLDHFFITFILLSTTAAAETNPITWSDRSSVHYDIDLHSVSPRTCHWHLNETFLRVPEIRDQLSRDMIEFFQLNGGTLS